MFGPRGAPPKGPGTATPGIGSPEPQRWTHPSPQRWTHHSPKRHAGHYWRRRSFSSGERAGHSEPLTTFEGPPRQNAWAHAPSPQRPQLGLPLRSPHIQQIGLAGLLGANPNSRWAPEGPHPRGLAPQRQGLGTRDRAPDFTRSPPPPGPLGAPPVIQAGEGAGPSEPLPTFDGPPAPKRLGPRSH